MYYFTSMLSWVINNADKHHPREVRSAFLGMLNHICTRIKGKIFSKHIHMYFIEGKSKMTGIAFKILRSLRYFSHFLPNLKALFTR